MHPALQIAEVVELICAEVVPPDDQFCVHASQTLARLARTSSIFLDAALGILWRHQGSLVNLIRVMPDDLWTIDEHGAQRLEISVNRPIVHSDWDRFLFYSRRVKIFTTIPIESYRLRVLVFHQAEVYDILTRSFPEQYLFPHLQKLDWALTAENCLHHVRFLLAPSLTDLHLSIVHTPQLSIFSTLTLHCTRLTQLDIAIPDLDATSTVSRYVCSLHSLESLTISHLDDAALLHISQLPRLRSLWLTSVAESVSFQPEVDSIFFSALEVLKIMSCEHTPAFLGSLVECSLVELRLLPRAGRTHTTRADAEDVYSALATHSHASLQELTILGAYCNPAQITVDQLKMYSVTAYTLTPLLLFHNLVRVSLFHAGGFEIDDSTIMEMARAWPRIQHLALKADRICRTEPQVTLHGLLAFATHCPVLQSLNITLDATGAVPKLRSRDFVSQHSLEVLHVVHSPVAEPLRAVAQFVGAIFPQLREITTLHADLPPQMTNPMLAGSHKVWMKVQKALCQEPWGGLDLKSS